LSLGESKSKFPEFTEIINSGLTVERDTRFPIRLTVQFYVCTDKDISDEDIKEIADKFRTIYDKGENEGSLVITDKEIPKPGVAVVQKKTRPTETAPQHLYSDDMTF
jgi:hypothetical protein